MWYICNLTSWEWLLKVFFPSLPFFFEWMHVFACVFIPGIKRNVIIRCNTIWYSVVSCLRCSFWGGLSELHLCLFVWEKEHVPASFSAFSGFLARQQNISLRGHADIFFFFFLRALFQHPGSSVSSCFVARGLVSILSEGIKKRL